MAKLRNIVNVNQICLTINKLITDTNQNHNNNPGQLQALLAGSFENEDTDNNTAMEALVFERPRNLLNLLQKLNDPEFALFTEFDKKQTRDKIVQIIENHPRLRGLVRWTNEDQVTASQALKKFDDYATTLENQTNSDMSLESKKALSIRTITPELIRNVNSQAPLTDKATNDDKFKILNFRLNALKTLHKHDDVFAQHRGWGSFFFNLFVGFATACFAFLFNGGLFFRKRTSEEHVKTIDKIFTQSENHKNEKRFCEAKSDEQHPLLSPVELQAQPDHAHTHQHPHHHDEHEHRENDGQEMSRALSFRGMKGRD